MGKTPTISKLCLPYAYRAWPMNLLYYVFGGQHRKHYRTDKIDEVLSTLTEDEEKYLRLFYQKDMTINLLAYSTGHSEQYVTAALHTAIERLRLPHRARKLLDDPELAGPAGYNILEQPIIELGVGRRAFNSLKRAHVFTVGDLVDRTEKDLIRVRNLGDKTLAEIKQALIDRGLTLKKEA